MTDPLPTYSPLMLQVIANAIGLPASEVGPLLRDSLAGQTSVSCGPEVAPANHSVVPGKDLEPPTPVICGQNSPDLSASADLQSSLASRLRARLAAYGSPELFADLEGMAYRRAGADLCAAGIGGPHIRQRLYWLADTGHAERRPINRTCDVAGRDVLRQERQEVSVESGQCSETGGMADNAQQRCGQRRSLTDGSDNREHADERTGPLHGGDAGRLVDADSAAAARLGTERLPLEPEQETGRPGNAGAWSDFDLIGCADGKARRVESGTFPLAHGIPNRMGRLRGYGNAIVPQLAAEFISAYMDCSPQH